MTTGDYNLATVGDVRKLTERVDKLVEDNVELAKEVQELREYVHALEVQAGTKSPTKSSRFRSIGNDE